METPWQNLTDAIFHQAERRPDAPALIDATRRLSYREYATLVGKASAYLREIGVRPGDRVAVALTNSTEHVVLSFAIMRAGGILVDMPWVYPFERREETLRRTGASKLFLELDAQPSAVAENHWLTPDWLETIARMDGDHRHASGADDWCDIGLTTGSTGASKSILKSHRHMLLRCHVLEDLYRGTAILSAERPTHFLLIGTLAGGVWLQRAVAQTCVGGSVVIMPGYLNTPDLIRAIAAWDEAVCFIVSPLCADILATAPQPQPLFPRIRALIAGGQPLAAEEKRQMLVRATPNFYEHYGNNGSGPTTLLRPHEMETKADTVGRPTALIKVQALDESGKPVPPGEIGRLHFSGPAVSTRFFNAADAQNSGEYFDAEGYFSGDLAAIGADGYIRFKGRLFNVIERSGVRVFAHEIETVLAAHPAVRAAAVVPRPAPGIGQEIVAFIVPRGDLPDAELVPYITERLAPEKRPNHIWRIAELPQTGAGKIDLARLVQLADEAARKGTSGR